MVISQASHIVVVTSACFVAAAVNPVVMMCSCCCLTGTAHAFAAAGGCFGGVTAIKLLWSVPAVL